MPVAAIIPLLDGILALAQTAAPHIAALLSSSEISKEDQQKLKDRIDQLKATNFAFTRPGE